MTLRFPWNNRQIITFLFSCSLFTLPFSKRIIFPADGFNYFTIFNDFLVHNLYLFEFFLITAGMFFLLNIKKYSLRIPNIILFFNSLFFLNLTLQTFFELISPTQLIFASLKIIEILIIALIFNNRLISKKIFLKILWLSALLQSLIIIGQFSLQHDLNLNFLGETILNPQIKWLAKIDWQNKQLLRGYGTFLHPNISAFFLGTVWLLNFLKQKKEGIFFYSMQSIILIAIILTFSRTVLITLILIFLFFLIWKKIKIHKQKITPRITLIILSLLVLAFFSTIIFKLIITRFSPQELETSLQTRFYLVLESLTIIKHNYLLGSGFHHYLLKLITFKSELNNFWEYQPVHNFWLIVLAEMWLITFIGFIFLVLSWIKYSLKKNNYLFFWLIFFILVTGLNDHLQWTSSQIFLFLWWYINVFIIFQLWIKNTDK